MSEFQRQIEAVVNPQDLVRCMKSKERVSVGYLVWPSPSLVQRPTFHRLSEDAEFVSSYFEPSSQQLIVRIYDPSFVETPAGCDAMRYTLEFFPAKLEDGEVLLDTAEAQLQNTGN